MLRPEDVLEETVVEIQGEADSLETARQELQKAISRRTELRVISEDVLDDGAPRTEEGVAETIETATQNAKAALPPDAQELGTSVVQRPDSRIMIVRGSDWDIAREAVERHLGRGEILRRLDLETEGSKGFLWIGKKPNVYRAKVLRQALVAVTYRRRAMIRVRAGQSPTLITQPGDLTPGTCIRIWHEMMHCWIPGWWCEVLKVENNRLFLRDLGSGEEKEQSVRDTLHGVYKHPTPEPLKVMGAERATAKQKAMHELKIQYDATDFIESSVDQMISILRSELQWRYDHDDQYYDLKDEFEIRATAIRNIGEALNRRGGEPLMLNVFKQVRGTRDLEGLWNGIGGGMG